jgi:GTP-binding protein
VKVTAARFLGAATAVGGGPPARLPEVAIAGRSNVGKSSLLNALLGRRGLARTSSTPGRTRQLNFFLVNDRFVLADLPGYGFAVGSEAERRSWGPLVEGFLRERATLRGVVLLVDVRRGLETEENELLAFLEHARLPGAVVATKFDKLGRGAAGAALAALRRRVGEGTRVMGFSARTGEGRDALWRVPRGWLEGPPRADAAGGL